MRKKGLRTHRTLARDDNALIDAMHTLPRPLNQVAQCPHFKKARMDLRGSIIGMPMHQLGT